jgi:endonuclease YncB( thermonuclease family)
MIRASRGASSSPGSATGTPRGRVAVAVSVALVVATVAGCGGTSGDGDDADAADDPEGTATIRAMEIVDGDTLRVSDRGDEETVRLIGINTPESGECFADEATDALTALVGTKPLRLLSDTSDLDRYGRRLRYVEVDGQDVGAALIEGGFAIARRYAPDVARQDAYAALQNDAQVQGRGLWAPDACGSAAVGAASIEIEVEPDPPGDDLDGTNGEWVRFTNTGNDSIDLSGWEVADESAGNRYRLGDIELRAGESLMLYTACGSDTALEIFWCSTGSAVWNNDGDTIFLRDRNGNIAADHAYGDSA